MLNPGERQQLLQLARTAIEQPLLDGETVQIDLQHWPQKLTRPGASFVTLKLAGKLRGCIGTIESHRALVLDVSANAYAAAFQDPRFEPVTANEVEQLNISLSILNQPRPVEFEQVTELHDILRPRVDGVILEAHGQRAVFLPQVWEMLPDPVEFLLQLRRKAGIPADIDPEALNVSRFQVEAF
ncbi:MAG: AmmeMemoRadiSam system protein A [Gammaproteobacteria bacterium]|nr:AmmeMemoRadiSam system protein A [Gammaproteobacteria bacterium]